LWWVVRRSSTSSSASYDGAASAIFTPLRVLFRVVHLIVGFTRYVHVCRLHVGVDTVPWYRSVSGVLFDVVAIGDRRASWSSAGALTIHARIMIFFFRIIFYVWTTMGGWAVGYTL
jgi:hypothetical protein